MGLTTGVRALQGEQHERLPTERTLTEQTRAFKNLRR
jgi:predicted TIM-barrel enzyme